MAGARWITFDCYGTLVDWWTGMGDAARAVAGERAEDLLDAYHAQELILEAERPAHSYRHVLTEGLRRAAAETGVELGGDGAQAFVNVWTSMPVFEDVGPALAELRDAGWKLAILTNCDDDLIAATQRHIPADFDMVVTAQQVGSYKPDLDHFRTFRERAGAGEGDWCTPPAAGCTTSSPPPAWGSRACGSTATAPATPREWPRSCCPA